MGGRGGGVKDIRKKNIKKEKKLRRRGARGEGLKEGRELVEEKKGIRMEKEVDEKGKGE